MEETFFLAKFTRMEDEECSILSPNEFDLYDQTMIYGQNYLKTKSAEGTYLVKYLSSSNLNYKCFYTNTYLVAYFSDKANEELERNLKSLAISMSVKDASPSEYISTLQDNRYSYSFDSFEFNCFSELIEISKGKKTPRRILKNKIKKVAL